VYHGLPDQPRGPIAQDMFPAPPKLLEGKGVTDDAEGVTFWKATHDIRLPGMPGFVSALSESERWQVTTLLAHADKLSPAVREELRH
jgi:hypothetical protein